MYREERHSLLKVHSWNCHETFERSEMTRTLEKRRNVAQLTMMFKVISGQPVEIWRPTYHVESNRALDNSIRRNVLKLRPAQKQTNISTIRDWNLLPNQVIKEQPVEAFKKFIM